MLKGDSRAGTARRDKNEMPEECLAFNDSVCATEDMLQSKVTLLRGDSASKHQTDHPDTDDANPSSSTTRMPTSVLGKTSRRGMCENVDGMLMSWC